MMPKFGKFGKFTKRVAGKKVKDEDDRPMAAFKMACFQWSKTIKTESDKMKFITIFLVPLSV
jgi:hypothetical protein